MSKPGTAIRRRNSEIDGCGFGSCEPKWMQTFACRPAWVLIMSLTSLVQGITYGYFISTLTTIEKRFKIPGKVLGFVMIGNEVSQIMFSLVVSHRGGRGHRPKWIGAGLLIHGFACATLVLPHAIYGPGIEALILTEQALTSGNKNITNIVQNQLCDPSRVPTDTKSCELGPQSWFPMVMIFISQFGMGIGNTVFYVLSGTYLDDNVKRGHTPMMIAVAMAGRLLGPAVGSAFASMCLNVYIAPSFDPAINQNDPRWLGAWWIGWPVLGFLLMVIAIFTSLFPRRLPPTDDELEQTNSELNGSSSPAKPILNNDVEVKPVETAPECPGVSEIIKRLLKNKLLICTCLSGVFYILGSTSQIFFSPKYLEIQYDQTASRASFLTGTLKTVFLLVGFLVAGAIMSKFQPRARFVAAWNVLVGLLIIASSIAFMFLTCPTPRLVGSFQQTGELEIEQSCNSNCNCDSVRYLPICDMEKKITFFSPCHAGCSETAVALGRPALKNCSCIPEEKLFRAPAVPGACDLDCADKFSLYGIVGVLVSLVAVSGKVGSILILFRCVSQVEKPLAMGLNALVFSLFGFIPGPIIFGFLVDSSCLVWEDKCGSEGNCWLYDAQKYAIYVNTLTIVFASIALIFDVSICYFCKDLQLYDEKPKLPEEKYTRIELTELTFKKPPLAETEDFGELSEDNEHNRNSTDC